MKKILANLTRIATSLLIVHGAYAVPQHFYIGPYDLASVHPGYVVPNS